MKLIPTPCTLLLLLSLVCLNMFSVILASRSDFESLAAKAAEANKTKEEGSKEAFPWWDPNVKTDNFLAYFLKQFFGKASAYNSEAVPPPSPQTQPQNEQIQDFLGNIMKSFWDLFKMSNSTLPKHEDNKESTKDEVRSSHNHTHKAEKPK